MLIIFMVACAPQSDKTAYEDVTKVPQSDYTKHLDYQNIVLSSMWGMRNLHACGDKLFYLNSDNEVIMMTYQDGTLSTKVLINNPKLDIFSVWNDDLIYRVLEDNSNVWYTYNIETDSSTELSLSISEQIFDALNRVDGINSVGDDLYVMHPYYMGISRINFSTGEYVLYDTASWNRAVLCAVDKSCFYVPGMVGMEVFDLISGEKTVYDWREHENWLGSAQIRSAYLTEDGKMYLHITREDAIVPDELKRAILYVDVSGDLSKPISLSTVGTLPAYSVTRVYGEYYGRSEEHT